MARLTCRRPDLLEALVLDHDWITRLLYMAATLIATGLLVAQIDQLRSASVDHVRANAATGLTAPAATR